MTFNNIVKGVNFPDYDANWKGVENFIKSKGLSELKIMAPAEFCLKFNVCVPYEWSYWNVVTEYDILIVQKGMRDQIKHGYLKGLNTTYDFVFSNAVFNVYLAKSKQSGLPIVRQSLSFFAAIRSLLTKVYYLSKQFKVKSVDQNILLVTANQCGNIGDDAITLAAKDILEEVYPGANIIIDKAPASKRLIQKSQLVVLGGGGIFYDHCFRNAQNYCQYLLYAKEANVKSAVIGIGAQGIATDMGKELYRHALNNCEVVSVRDSFSYTVLMEKLRLSCPVYLNQDVVFSFPFSNNSKKKSSSAKPKLLYSLLDASQMPTSDRTQLYQQSQMPCLAYLTAHFDVELFVQSIDDMNIYQEFSKKFNLKVVRLKYQDTQKVVDYYRSADLVVTARLHGFIFAVLAQVPVVTVASPELNFKLGSMVNLSLPSAKHGLIPLRQYSPELLKEKIEGFLKKPTDFLVDNKELQENIRLSRQVVEVLQKHIGSIGSRASED